MNNNPGESLKAISRLILRLLLKKIGIPTIAATFLVLTTALFLIAAVISTAIHVTCMFLPTWLAERVWDAEVDEIDFCPSTVDIFRDKAQELADARDEILSSNDYELVGPKERIDVNLAESYLRALTRYISSDNLEEKHLEEYVQKAYDELHPYVIDLREPKDEQEDPSGTPDATGKPRMELVNPTINDVINAWAKDQRDPNEALMAVEMYLQEQMQWAMAFSPLAALECGPGDLDGNIEGLSALGERLGFTEPPVRKINSAYGTRLHPIRKRCIQHNGIDLAMGGGQIVRALHTGKVLHAGTVAYSSLMGYGPSAVVIKDDNNYVTLYAHLGEVSVRRGQIVDAGEVIGRIATMRQIEQAGPLASATGPHLHLELRYVPQAGWGTAAANGKDPCILFRCTFEHPWWKTVDDYWRLLRSTATGDPDA